MISSEEVQQMKAYKQKNIKEHNQDLLIELLKQNASPMTKRQLSEQSHLSVVTINKLIPEIVQKKIFIELDTPFETGGRHAIAYKFNERRKLFLINQFIEKENKMVVNFYIVDLLGHIIKKETLSSIQLVTFLETISNIKSKFPEISLSLSGIAGVEVDKKLKIMDFEPFRHLDLNDEITKKIAIDSFVENDVNAATFGYSLESKHIIAGAYFPESFPPGASLIINQQIFRGYNNLSGEIKHLPNLKHTKFPLKNSELNSILTETLQSIIAMYDPHEIILYVPEKWLSYIEKKLIIKKLSEVFPYNVFPKITISQDFSQNYLNGLIKLGLEKITMKD